MFAQMGFVLASQSVDYYVPFGSNGAEAKVTKTILNIYESLFFQDYYV